MPYIEEEDLLELHKQIERNKERLSRLVEQVDFYSAKAKRNRKAKRFFIAVSIVFFSAILCAGWYIRESMQQPLKVASLRLCKVKNIEKRQEIQLLNVSDSLNFIQKDTLVDNQGKFSIEQQLGHVTKTEQDRKKESVGNPAFYSVKPDKKEEKAIKKSSIIYSVQIGTFEKLNLPSENFENIWVFKDSFFTKYAIGNFERLSDAKSFRKILLKLGFKDCFVISIKEGKRLKIERSY